MASSTSRQGQHNRQPSRNDFVTRLHTDALNTPTTLDGAIDISNAQIQEDSSSSESDFRRTKPAKSKSKAQQGHSRSRSNPFPVLLEGIRKRPEGPNGQPRLQPDLDWGDEERKMAGPSVAKHRPGGSSASRDFATGNCMTCSSLMRWPKDLKVFKCTICATINDLVKPGSENSKGAFLGLRKDANSQSAPATPPCQPISIQTCHRIVRQCIHLHVSRKLISDPSHGSAAGRRPSDTQRHHAPANGNWSFANAGRRPSGSPYEGRQVHYDPQQVLSEEPTLRPSQAHSGVPGVRSYSSSYPERPALPVRGSDPARSSHPKNAPAGKDIEPKRIFKRLEDYIVSAFGSLDAINSSFLAQTPYPEVQSTEKIRRKPVPSRERSASHSSPDDLDGIAPLGETLDDLDPKLLLLGDVAENGLWWTGGQKSLMKERRPSSKQPENSPKRSTTTKSPNINWEELAQWYSLVLNAAENWFTIYEDVCRDPRAKVPTESELQLLEKELLQGQIHTQRVLLKATESLLKRPGRPVAESSDIRFLILILENPLLHPNMKPFNGLLQPDEMFTSVPDGFSARQDILPSSGLLSGQHSGIIKRIIGLISNSSGDCHKQLINWLSKYNSTRFVSTKDLVSGFLSYRLLRQIDKKRETQVDITAGLIPEMRIDGAAGSSYLHDEIRQSNASKKKEPEQKIAYTEDWQIKAAARVLALIFAANNPSGSRNGLAAIPTANVAAVGSTRDYSHFNGQQVPTSDFYNSMIDYADLVGDFESWETRRTKFSFCQYPFLLSIWAKTHILEYDARRQMQMKARDAFLDSIMTNRNIKQYLSLDVRRDCLVDDSLNAVSEVIGSGSEDIKKGLRITFRGEEGIDGGGLRKEWFLLLVREVFNPDHGLFLYDEDSQYCYFNPNSFEVSDQFFLIGVVMGLAIYNSTILDVALPPFAFRKLLASAPAHGLGMSSRPRPSMQYTIEDLAEYRPRVARGLQQLLEFEGDVESTFSLDFVIDTERYGTTTQVPLCQGGEHIPVTNDNRREYVNLYVRYVLDTAVKRQFEPFKRGFYTVCGGNAFSLFRPEEIELLIRGSDEALDISSLRAVAQYDNWDDRQPDGKEAVVSWFWETFEAATPANQRKLLLFVTGSDRIPATGAATLPIKVSCLGDDCGRYPIARTCFNMISLWRYGSKERLESMLWRAVLESEGFGLK